MEQGPASKRILILGGSTKDGIGAAIADRVNYLGHVPLAPPQSVVDVTASDQSTLREVIGSFLPDSVVYSVGMNELEWIHALDRKSFDRIMETNVWGFLNVLQVLEETGRSFSVLAISSDAAVRPMRTTAAYCASKAALNMAIRVASRELAGEGWRINGLAPGKVEGTPMTRYVDKRVPEVRGWTTKRAEEYEISTSPIRRKIFPAEVAAVALDILLSDAIAWTGDIVTVNGGRW